MGRKRAMQEFGDWTDRVKAGELPARPAAPRKALSVNVVITQWGLVRAEKNIFHDEISTDRRNSHDERQRPCLTGSTKTALIHDSFSIR